jgi:hypothetical protein
MKQFYELPETYIDCDCSSHLLKLVYDEDEEEKYRYLYISFFNEGHSGHHENLWRRLKLIWYILIHGTPWADMVCLNKHERLKLTDYLNNLNEN